jgi:hypothetical protein
MFLRQLGKKVKVFRIPLRILKTAKLFGKIIKNRMTRFQIKSLEIDKIYDIKPSIKALKYKPTPLKVGLKKTLKFFKPL